MQELKGKGMQPGVQSGSSVDTELSGQGKKVLPDIRLQASSLLETIQDLDPLLTNQERLVLDHASRILTGLIEREQEKHRGQRQAVIILAMEGAEPCPV